MVRTIFGTPAGRVALGVECVARIGVCCAASIRYVTRMFQSAFLSQGSSIIPVTFISQLAQHHNVSAGCTDLLQGNLV